MFRCNEAELQIGGVLLRQSGLYKKLLCSCSWKRLAKRATVKDQRSKFCDLLYTYVEYMEVIMSLICAFVR